MSACTTSMLFRPATTSRRTGISARSNSTATSRLQRAASAMVSVPAPAPTSRTSSRESVPAASATASRSAGSIKQSPAAGGSLHLLKKRDRVGALLVGELLEADPAQLRDEFRRVDEVGGAVGHAHPFLGVAVPRVGLQQQAIGGPAVDGLTDR